MYSIFCSYLSLAVTHAQAATALKKDGHVYWDDGIGCAAKNYQTWLNDLIKFKPDLIIFETTTPIEFMWDTVNEVKTKLPNSKVVMSGYHVMRSQMKLLKNLKPILF